MARLTRRGWSAVTGVDAVENLATVRRMPELFPNLPAFLASLLIMALAMFVYATVGFGAGMVAVALLAFVLPDLAGTVAVLMVLTFATEVSVLARSWRRADLRVLAGLVVPMGIGLWLGTGVLGGG